MFNEALLKSMMMLVPSEVARLNRITDVPNPTGYAQMYLEERDDLRKALWPGVFAFVCATLDSKGAGELEIRGLFDFPYSTGNKGNTLVCSLEIKDLRKSGFLEITLTPVVADEDEVTELSSGVLEALSEQVGFVPDISLDSIEEVPKLPSSFHLRVSTGGCEVSYVEGSEFNFIDDELFPLDLKRFLFENTF